MFGPGSFIHDYVYTTSLPYAPQVNGQVNSAPGNRIKQVRIELSKNTSQTTKGILVISCIFFNALL